MFEKNDNIYKQYINKIYIVNTLSEHLFFEVGKSLRANECEKKPYAIICTFKNDSSIKKIRIDAEYCYILHCVLITIHRKRWISKYFVRVCRVHKLRMS